MRNIELKCWLRDRAGVERRLRALGARRCWVREQRDTFFAVSQGWLKLRVVAGCTPPVELIAYVRATDRSGPRSSHYEIAPVSEPEALARTLGRVLPTDGVVEKERTLWLYESTRIHLDRVRGLGDFVELETLVDERDPSRAEAESNRVLRALELDPADFLSRPYRDLLRAAPDDGVA